MNSLCKLSPFANGRSILFSNAHGVCRTRAPYTMQVYHHYTPVQWTKPDICSSPLCTETTHRSNRPSQTLVPAHYAPRLHTGRTDQARHLFQSIMHRDYTPVEQTKQDTCSSPLCTETTHRSNRPSQTLVPVHHAPRLHTGRTDQARHLFQPIMHRDYTPVEQTKPDTCSSPICTETTHRSNRPSQTLVPVQYAPRLLYSCEIAAATRDSVMHKHSRH